MLFLCDLNQENEPTPTANFYRLFGSKDKKQRMKRRFNNGLTSAVDKALLIGGTSATLAAVSPELLNKTNRYSNLVKASLLAGGIYGLYKGLKTPIED